MASARIKNLTVAVKSPNRHAYTDSTLFINVDDDLVQIVGEMSYTGLNKAMKLATAAVKPQISREEKARRVFRRDEKRRAEEAEESKKKGYQY